MKIKVAIKSKYVMKSISLPVFLLLTLLSMACKKDNKNTGSNGTNIQQQGNNSNFNASFVNKFVRFSQGQQYTGIKSLTWTDTAWIGDRIHSQLVLWSTTKSYTNISCIAGKLTSGTGTIPGSEVRLRYENYITGDHMAETCAAQISRSPVKIADALSLTPVTSLNAKDPLKIWVTIDVPSNTLPGTYIGIISISANGVPEKIMNVKLTVVNRTLPAAANWQFHLDLWQFPFQLLTLYNAQNPPAPITAFSSQYFALISPYYKMLADGGQSSITTYIKDGAFTPGKTMINWTRNTDGTWAYDYTNFDKYVDTLMSWGINKEIDCFSLVGWERSIGYLDVTSGTYQTLNDTLGTTGSNSRWSNFLTSFKSHLEAKGWFDKTVLFMDEVPDSTVQIINTLVKNNSQSWRIGLAGSNHSAATEAELYDYSIILGSQRANNPSVNSISTFYTSCTQTIPNDYLTPQNNPAELPWMAWYAAANGLNGYLRWAYDYWTLNDPANIEDGSNTAGDFSFIYRTNNSFPNPAISSIRFELLREGIQDFEKIRLLNSSSVNLKTLINQFTTASGNNAESLVSQGEHLLKSLSVNN